MARGAAKQKPVKTRPAPHGQRPAGRSTTKGGMAVEDTMFFPRLRNHAKPVFVFLAVIFGAGFVFLGVGSGSSGISDLLNPSQWFSGSSGGTNLGSLQKKAAQHPLNAQDQIDYATALTTKGQQAQAIAVLAAYSRRNPKNTDVLSDLASRYETQAQIAFQQQQDAQNSAASVSGLLPTLTSPGKNGTPVITDPIVSAVTSKAQDASTKAQTAEQIALGNDVRVLKLLVKNSPDDTTSLFRLAEAASVSGDSKTAIASYKRFIKLAPDAPEAALAKQRLKQLQTPAVSPSSGG